MRILVSTASRHGSTTEVAARVAGTLRVGLPADTVVDELAAAEVDDPASYDAVVLGSAVYLGRWLDDARKLTERIAVQPPRPVWLDVDAIDSWGTEIAADLSRARAGKP